MATREEIREGIAFILGCGTKATLTAERIIKYLHSQGLRLPNGEALIDETNK